MPLFSRGPSIPRGWVPAPGDVQAEIFLVWQEDELPDELTKAPGYVPFTLSPGAEQWVRGMAEIKEIDGPKEKLVIGRPRPAIQTQHRPLIPEPAPSPPAAAGPGWEPSAPAWDAIPSPAWDTPPPAWEPHMAAKEWIRRQAPREPPAIAVRVDTAAPAEPEPRQRPAPPHPPPAIGAPSPPAAGSASPPAVDKSSPPAASRPHAPPAVGATSPPAIDTTGTPATSTPAEPAEPVRPP